MTAKELLPSELARLREIETDGGSGFSGRQPHVTDRLIARKLLRRTTPEVGLMLSRDDVEITDLGRGVLAMAGMLQGNLKAPHRLVITDEVDEWPPGFMLPSRQVER